MRDVDRHIVRSLDIANKLISLADQGVADSRDDGCLSLYGLVRDCAYRIRRHAERERDLHRWASGQRSVRR
jgi:hypothetical protein